MKKKFILLSILPIIIGVGLFVFGFITTVSQDPLDTSNFFVGPVIILAGFIFMFAGSVFFVVNPEKNNQQEILNEENVEDENEEPNVEDESEEPNDIFDVLQTIRKKVKNINQCKCKYCDSTFDIKETKCPNCGAKYVD